MPLFLDKFSVAFLLPELGLKDLPSAPDSLEKTKDLRFNRDIVLPSKCVVPERQILSGLLSENNLDWMRRI